MSIDIKTEEQMAAEGRTEAERLTAQAEYVATFVAERIGASAVRDGEQTWVVQPQGSKPPLSISMGVARGRLNHYAFQISLSEMPEIWQTEDGENIAVFNNANDKYARTIQHERMTFSTDGYTTFLFGSSKTLFSADHAGARRVA